MNTVYGGKKDTWSQNKKQILEKTLPFGWLRKKKKKKIIIIHKKNKRK